MRRILNVVTWKKKENEENADIPDELLSIMGRTPAITSKGLRRPIRGRARSPGSSSAHSSSSRKALEAISKDPIHWGPLSLRHRSKNAMIERYLTGRFKAHARLAARAGRNPDIFGAHERLDIQELPPGCFTA